MQYFTIAAAFLAAVASAAPTAKRQEYQEVGLSFHVLNEEGQVVGEPAPVQIGVLTNTDNVTAYEIVFDGTSTNVDINSVVCQAYKDAAGTILGSAEFTYAQPAELATPNNPVETGSVRCWVQ